MTKALDSFFAKNLVKIVIFANFESLEYLIHHSLFNFSFSKVSSKKTKNFICDMLPERPIIPYCGRLPQTRQLQYRVPQVLLGFITQNSLLLLIFKKARTQLAHITIFLPTFNVLRTNFTIKGKRLWRNYHVQVQKGEGALQVLFNT